MVGKPVKKNAASSAAKPTTSVPRARDRQQSTVTSASFAASVRSDSTILPTAAASSASAKNKEKKESTGASRVQRKQAKKPTITATSAPASARTTMDQPEKSQKKEESQGVQEEPSMENHKTSGEPSSTINTTTTENNNSSSNSNNNTTTTDNSIIPSSLPRRRSKKKEGLALSDAVAVESFGNEEEDAAAPPASSSSPRSPNSKKESSQQASSTSPGKNINNNNKKNNNQNASRRSKHGSPVSAQSPTSDAQQQPSGASFIPDALRQPRPYAVETDFVDALYTPHTLTAIVVLLLSLAYLLRWYYYPNMKKSSSVQLGLLASAWVFFVFGLIHLPDSLLVRPHPFIWRGVLAVLIMYLLLLTFLGFQDLETVRTIIGYYDPKTLVKPADREYATDCRMSTAEDPYLFFHTAFDSFIIAHSLGYFMKTLIIRDWRIVTCVSIGFEIFEITFQHLLPNFRECWWDHLILDVLVCNTGGTILGLLALRALKAKEYRWVKVTSIRSVGGKAKRVLGQLGPRSFEAYEWNVFYSFKRLMEVIGLLSLLFLQELNCFVMKHILQWEPEHHLVIGRLLLWSLAATPTLREFYVYISDPSVKRLGTTAWVAFLTLLLETLFLAKLAYEGNYFREPFPCYISIPWTVAFVLFVVWTIAYFSMSANRRSRGVVRVFLNTLFYGAFVSLGLMCLMGLPDLQILRREFIAFVRSVAGEQMCAGN